MTGTLYPPSSSGQAGLLSLQAETVQRMTEAVYLVRERDSAILWANPSFERLFGYEPGELTGQHVSIVNAPTERDPQEVAREILAHLIRTGTWTGEVLNRKKDGTTFLSWANVSTFEDAQHGRVFVSFHQDITQRKEEEAALKAREHRFRALLESSWDSIALFDSQGDILYASPSTTRVLGYEIDEFLTKNAFDLVHPDDHQTARRQLARSVENPGTAVPVRARVRRHDGVWRVLEGVFTNLLDDPHVGGIVNNYRDVTERLEAEQRRAELIDELEAKNAELERFTYTVSHDLKSPLVTIRGFAGLLQRDLDLGDTDKARADARRIEDAADRMGRLLNDLLELSLIGRVVNPPEEIRFGELAREVAATIEERGSGVGVEIQVAPKMPVVFGDRVRLCEVLENLIENACRFMGEQAEPRVQIGFYEAEGEAVFWVRDNGIGIAPEHQEQIFDLFTRLDPSDEGTGIGLAIVRRIIEVHGGHIWVESDGRGKGSSFCFTLASKPAVAATPP